LPSPHVITRAIASINITRNEELTTEVSPNTGTLISNFYIVSLSKNTAMENPKLAKKEKFTQNVSGSHAKENDFEEKRKKRPIALN
jgi:hypothetical protein